MKATGLTRRVDSLGRVVIPKELRKSAPHTGGKSFRNIYRW